jgi:uncharacterized protein
MIPKLHAHLQPLGRVAVAYSGGVDSTLVLKAALGCARQRKRRRPARRLAQSAAKREGRGRRARKQLGARLELLQTEETNDPQYQANAPNRCYFCKDHVYRVLRQFAEQNGIAHVLDGMNAEDTLDVRPGRAAARELKILSPLHDLGFSKKDVREAAKALGLAELGQARRCLSRLARALRHQRDTETALADRARRGRAV